MRRFIYKLLLIVLPIGLMISLVNYIVDPAHVFSSEKYVSGIADILAKGHNVNNIANCDERLLQEQMITKIPGTPDIVILGSSRIMEIGTDFFSEKRVLNCGVSHATINDILSLTGILDSADKLPKKIVLNLDPFLVCKGGSSQWQSLYQYYTYFLKKLNLGPKVNKEDISGNTNKLYTLVSFEYFEKSLDFVFQGKTDKYKDVGLQEPTNYGRYTDGTICYPYSYTHSDTIKVASDARDAANREDAILDSSKVFLLNTFLDFLQKKNIEVVLVMLPFHSQYYSLMNLNRQYPFFSYETFFIKMAEQRHLVIKGGFDPVKLEIPQSQFYDTYHCSKEAIKKIFPFNTL